MRGLETDSFAAAILQYRSTPYRYLGVSPAQILFARNHWDEVCVASEQLQLRTECPLKPKQREQALM